MSNAENFNRRFDFFYLALCIHVSPECKEVLDQLGGYHLEERGEVEMKVGKDNFINIISPLSVLVM